MERDQLGTLSPADAAVALRSYARRFREAFAEAEAASGPVDFSRTGTGGASPALLLATTTETLRRLQRGVERALTDEGPALEPNLLDRPAPAPANLPRNLEDGLAALSAVVAAFADVAQRASLRDWDRGALVGQRPVSALDLLKEAVAVGRNGLDELTAALARPS